MIDPVLADKARAHMMLTNWRVMLTHRMTVLIHDEDNLYIRPMHGQQGRVCLQVIDPEYVDLSDFIPGMWEDVEDWYAADAWRVLAYPKGEYGGH